MARKCSTCQHIKRAEIDRRLAAGEPGDQIARDYDLNPSSLHRHRTNCLKLSSSNAIMKEVSRGTAAVACLPSKEELNGAYFELRIADRPDRHPGRAARLAAGRVIRAQLNPTYARQPVAACRIRPAGVAGQCRRADQCQLEPDADRRAGDREIRPRAGTEGANRASTIGDRR